MKQFGLSLMIIGIATICSALGYALFKIHWIALCGFVGFFLAALGSMIYEACRNEE